MKNHGLIQVDKTLLMMIQMEQEKREKEKAEKEKKDKLKTQPPPLWRNDSNK
jgi:hypothetical protein